MRASAGERVAVVLIFAPQIGFYTGWFAGYVLEKGFDYDLTWALLWKIAIPVFAVSAGVIWYMTGRDGRRGSGSEGADDSLGDYSGGCGGGGGDD